MSSWLDRNWSNKNATASNNSFKSIFPNSSSRLSFLHKQRNTSANVSDPSTLKWTRWTKSLNGITKTKQSNRLPERNLLRSSIFDRPCTIKILPPKRNLMNYSITSGLSNSASPIVSASSKSPTNVSNVMTTLKQFDNRVSSKRTCSELNEIFDLTSGAVKKRRKTIASHSEAVSSDVQQSTTALASTEKAASKGFWRDAALLASLSTSRQWLTEEMNKTVSAAYDPGLVGNAISNDNPVPLSRCTTPESVQGSDISTSTFQKSGQSNSLFGGDSRPSSVANYSFHQQNQNSSQPINFSQPVYNFQPVKIVLREVSTNTESDWNSHDDILPDSSGKNRKRGKVLTDAEIEKDREFEDARVRRLLGIEDSTPSSFEKSKIQSNSVVSEAPVSSAPTLSTFNFKAPEASVAIFSSDSAAVKTSSETINKEPVSKTLMSSVSEKLSSTAPSDQISLEKPEKSLFTFGQTSTSAAAVQPKPTVNFASSVKSDNGQTIATSSASIFSNISFNSSVVPPKTSTPNFNFGSKPIETLAVSNAAPVSSSVLSSAPSAAPPVASVPSFSFTAPKSQESATVPSFNFSMPKTATTSSSQNETAAPSVVSSSSLLTNFKFGPASTTKSLTFGTATTTTSGTSKPVDFSFGSQTNTNFKPFVPPSQPVVAPQVSLPSFAPTSSSSISNTGMFNFGQKSAASSTAVTQTSSMFGQSIASVPAGSVSSTFGSNLAASVAPKVSPFASTPAASSSTSSTSSSEQPKSLFGSASTNSFGSASTSSNSIFGSTFPATSQSISNTNTAFGQNQSSTIPTQNTASAGLFKFGPQNATSAAQTSSTFSFGGTASSTTTSGGIFGATASTSTFQNFASSTSTAVVNPFATGNSISGSISGVTPATNLFGATPTNSSTSTSASSIFGSNAATTNLFGGSQSTNNSNNFFGAKSTAPAFGGNSNSMNFAASNPAPSASIFGASTPSMNAPAPAFGQGTGIAQNAPAATVSAPAPFSFGQTPSLFNFGGGASGGNVTFGGSNAPAAGMNSAVSADQPQTAAVGGFNVGVNGNGADSTLPQRRIRTAARKGVKPTRK